MNENSVETKDRMMAISKGALVLILPLFAITCILFLTFYLSRTQATIGQIFSTEKGIIDQQLNDVDADIDSICTDLIFLAAHNHLKPIANNQHPLSLFREEFYEFSSAKKVYDQVRYLDASGMETIRINFNSGNPAIVPPEKLQNKKGRYYFDEAFALNKGEIFISPLDLNIEHGQVEQPRKPMIRFGMPIFDFQGNKSGIVLLNYFGSYLLDRFKELGGSSLGSSLLLNRSGYYLVGESSEAEWGFMFTNDTSKEKTFALDYPEAWSKIAGSERGQFETGAGLFTYATAYPLSAGMKSSTGTGMAVGQSESLLNNDEYYWKLVSFVPKDILYAGHVELKLILGSFMACLLILIGWGSWKLSASRYGQKQSEAVIEEQIANLQAENIRRAEAEESLIEKTTLLDNILRNASNIAIATTDLDYRITYYNPMAEKLFGYSAGEVIGKTVQEIHTHENVSADRFDKALSEVRQSGEYRYSLIQETDNGKRYIDSRVSGMFNQTGQLVGFSLFSWDVTKEKLAAEERERLLQAIDQSNETIVITDPEGTMQYVNPAFEKITGYTYKEVIGQNPRILKGGQEDDRVYRELWNTLARGEMWRGRFINKKKDGTLYTEDATISPVFDGSGEIANYIAVKRDITREVEMEKQLHQKHKMEAVGLMAGGMAHNFNNNLAIILGNVELAQLKRLQGDDFIPLLKNAKTAALRARDLIQNILTHSREGAHSANLIQLPVVVNETTNLLRSTIPTTISIELTISPDSNAATVDADSSQVQEVLFNLCNNAVHAMDEDGVLKIDLDTVGLRGQDIPIQYDCQPGRYVKLRVQDNGSGMSAETVEKIFDPFFTTKEVGQGTGMGLATVYGIIKHHNGMIKVTSTLGEGTAFDLYFPVTDQNQTVEIKPEDTTLPKGTERILLVDDDKLLAELGEEILTAAGYQVTTVTSSTKAMEIFATNPDHFDLIITDQTMPELNGKDMIRNIKKIRSNVPTILCTGHSNKIDEKVATELGINAFLMKPVQLSKLLQVVRMVLDGALEIK